MKALTKEGQQYVNDIAAKYNLKNESVEALLKAIINGGGSMAQFNIPELGGQGQWMKGGMTMVGDMFNSSLKGTVDKLSSELSGLVTTKVLFEETSDLTNGKQETLGHFSGSAGASWPSVFGNPTSSGSQNNFRYAYFGPVRRLVIEDNGKRTIYDTKHHHITGISQQQGAGSSYKFTSQEGQVDLNSLSVISEPSEQKQATPEIAYDVTSNADLRSEDSDASPQDIIIATIEKINILFERGQITEEEFNEKKKELLAKL
ncbi:SHOCT domain-containing protein [Dyadobacter sp. CY323]|uniref:SHOCT domain-containing protein n=1 Tax=Dyadobacter sp. CY323 TaxID=2907302 RepID=UPI001F35E940|nr:SHOCT domain-containing protein [Dyadobacter sp. CY323]MCE6988256.1 SHOCT domain-containing protein [Dyadobacter sp. CY323]